MGVFTRHVHSLNAGESVTIKAPGGVAGVKKLYVTSTNITYANIKTDQYVNSVPKSANTNYAEGYYPLEQTASEIFITVFGMGAAENVTFVIEWG